MCLLCITYKHETYVFCKSIFTFFSIWYYVIAWSCPFCIYIDMESLYVFVENIWISNHNKPVDMVEVLDWGCLAFRGMVGWGVVSLSIFIAFISLWFTNICILSNILCYGCCVFYDLFTSKVMLKGAVKRRSFGYF